MTTLYIDRKGSRLREDSGSIAVYVAAERVRAFPVRMLDAVVVTAGAEIESNVLLRLSAAGVPVTILNRRAPSRSACFAPARSPLAGRRIAQYRASLDPAWRCQWSVRILRAKFRGQIITLLEALRLREDLRAPLAAGIERLRAASRSLDAAPADPESLLGKEGAAGAAYFDAYRRLFAPALNFAGRNRRPPRDPVNACLSLAYTLAYAIVSREAVAAGLDPLIGFYHEPLHARDSLFCDLLEPLRPRLDRWIWRLFRERTLRPEHFRASQAPARWAKPDGARSIARLNRSNKPADARPQGCAV